MDSVSAASSGSVHNGNGEIKDILDGLVEDVERCAALERLERAREEYEDRVSTATALFRAVHRSEARVDVMALARLTTHSRAEYSYGVLEKEGGLEFAALNRIQDGMNRANQQEVDRNIATVHERRITRDVNQLYRAKRVERHEEIARLQGEVATLTSRVHELEAKLRDRSVGPPESVAGNHRRGWREICIWASLVSSSLVIGGILIRGRK